MPARTRVVIQSRLNSSRLPGKAMLSVAGMPLIELVARRVANTGHEVVVATSREALDDHIADHLASVGVPVMRGSLDDVLGRFVAATADLAGGDRVVRMTGDNPVADGTLVDELAAAMDVAGNTYGRVDIDQVPEGIGCEVFTAENLRDADASATEAYDREHVTPWLRRTFGELLWAPSAVPTDLDAYRATVDSLADYDRVARVFRRHADPVTVPFRTLMADVATAVDGLGPRVQRSPDGLPSVVVDLSAAPALPAEGLRTVLATASARGADLVVADATDLAALRVVADSALRGRLRVLLRLGDLAADTTADGLRAVVERAFAVLGGRTAYGLLVPDDVPDQVLGVVDGYLAEGVVHTRVAPSALAGRTVSAAMTDLRR